MATFNKWIGIGRVTADPESRAAGAFQIMQVRFAVSERSKKKPDGTWENDPNPLYMDMEVWKRDKKGLYEVIEEFVRKGDELHVEGKLKMESWDDKNSPGTKRYKVKLALEEMQMLGGKKGDGEQPAPKTSQQSGGYKPQPAPNSDVDDSNIPF